MENVGKIWKDLEISVIIELPSWKPLKETFRQLCVGVAIQDIGGIAKDSWLDKSLYCYKSSTVLIFALVDVYNMDFLQFCFHYIYIWARISYFELEVLGSANGPLATSFLKAPIRPVTSS
jgi:hypothetical protein